MPTVCGMRRRGIPADSMRRFCFAIGVSKVLSMVDNEFLNFIAREDLNKSADRAMAVLEPLKVVITNIQKIKLNTPWQRTMVKLAVVLQFLWLFLIRLLDSCAIILQSVLSFRVFDNFLSNPMDKIRQYAEFR